jgi:hypothetical protein
MSAMSRKETDACIGESLAYNHFLRKAGHDPVIPAEQPVEAATLIWVLNGSLSTSGGPFAETKAQPRRKP